MTSDRRSFGCVARSAVLLKPNVASSSITITVAINCNSLSLLIFEETWTNYASRPKSAPNSDSFWLCRLFNVCVLIFCVPNALILLVYIPAKIKMCFIWKDDFLFTKIGIFCKSIAGPLSEVYTQPYSFGGRIKLIICQIRHELSVTIDEISTSWKNMLDGWPYTSKNMN